MSFHRYNGKIDCSFLDFGKIHRLCLYRILHNTKNEEIKVNIIGKWRLNKFSARARYIHTTGLFAGAIVRSTDIKNGYGILDFGFRSIISNHITKFVHASGKLTF